jgi:cytochrome c-type biogenesis protein CcmH
MKLLRHAIIVLALLSSASAWAVQPDEVLSDSGLEARARSLSKELRCMVCQNQSIDDSAAPLARDLRVLVRERLTGGDSDQQVLDFLVARYGEFVLLKPRFAWHTALLWLGPPGALIGGALVLLVIARRRGRSESSPAGREIAVLTPAEEARLARLMRSGER